MARDLMNFPGNDPLGRGIRKMSAKAAEGICPFCSWPVDPTTFRDERSRREFEISGLCQNCQDGMFGS